MAQNLTNEAWKKLFHQLNLKAILNKNGVVYITSDDIKKHCGREPRLMCKFDDRQSRPKLLRDNNVTIFPVKNGVYALVSGDGYQSLPSISKDIEFLEWSVENKFETLPKDPRSESQVIDMAFATGLLAHFLDDKGLTLTIRGRLRTKPFSYYFKGENQNIKLNANGVQVEVDAGYEGKKIYLIEAKMGERDDFHARQLFFPLRMWYEEDITKDVVPIFINYANETVSISKYEFEDIWDYSSIRLLRSTNYSFEHNPVKFSLADIFNNLKPDSQEPKDIPFPQADDIRRVRDTVDLISWGYTSRDQVSEFWGIDKRQGDYYANAGMYLGLINKGEEGWMLSSLGRKFISLATTKRNKLLGERILSHPVFYYAAAYYFEHGVVPNLDLVCKELQRHTDHEFAASTLRRRSKTIYSWLDYLIKAE